jgi:ribosomal protein S18 acetylase RimI-like enzyme
VVLDLLNEAAAWLAERDLAGWQVGQWRQGTIAAAIEHGETYLARDGDAVVATVNLQWSDDLIWPDAAGDAGYVHRLAVARAAHGRAIGHAVLAFAARAAREHGKRYVRLDCPCASAGLRAYYTAAGFTWRGDREIRGATDTWCAALFERAL